MSIRPPSRHALANPRGDGQHGNPQGGEATQGKYKWLIGHCRSTGMLGISSKRSVMRRTILFSGMFFGTLFLAPPAFSLSYSGSAWLDLTTLAFSGINVSVSPEVPPNHAEGPQHQVAFTATEFPDGSIPNGDPRAFANPCNGFCQSEWKDHTIMAITQVGASISTASSGVLSSTSSLLQTSP